MFTEAFRTNTVLHQWVEAALGRFADESHSIQHIYRVLGYLDRIYPDVVTNENPSNREILLWAAACHDNRDHKYTGCITDDEEKEFLEKHLESRSLVVMEIISKVSWSKQVALGRPAMERYGQLLYLLQDADRLDAMGEQGLERCRIFNGLRNPGLSPQGLEGLVREHVEEKLIKLYDALNFDASRRVADADDLVAPLRAMLQ
jgi:HD superfamily phosphodiesterase